MLFVAHIVFQVGDIFERFCEPGYIPTLNLPGKLTEDMEEVQESLCSVNFSVVANELLSQFPEESVLHLEVCLMYYRWRVLFTLS